MEEKRSIRSHYKIVNGTLVEKVGYETEQEALTVARYLNTKPNVINKMVVYKCSKCDKWHIGNNKKPLTEKDREKAKKNLGLARLLK